MPSTTLIFAVPALPPGQFVSSIHDSTLQPISLSEVTGWWKVPKDFHQPLLWTNLVIFPGENVDFPEAENPHQGMTDWWKITISPLIETKLGLANSSSSSSSSSSNHVISQQEGREATELPQRQLGNGKAIFQRPKHWPESLLRFQGSNLLRAGPVIAVCLLHLLQKDSRERFANFVQDIRKTVASTPGVGIHAFGKIQSSAGNAPGQFQEAILLQYNSMEDYAASINQGWWDKVVRTHKLDKTMEDSAQLLVQPLSMPAKGTKLDLSDWVYGDPYQRPGECWFG